MRRMSGRPSSCRDGDGGGAKEKRDKGCKEMKKKKKIKNSKKNGV
jgi:hypothetical protein